MAEEITNWNARYAAGDTPWDEGGPHPAIVEFVTAFGAPKGRILVPGCGLGHDVRSVVTPENEVIGVDIAPNALAQARAFPRMAYEEYEEANFFDLPLKFRGVFDWVIEHTCFCAIDPARRAEYVQGTAAALKPDGRIFAVFYLDPANERRPPFGVTVAELDRLFSPAFAVVREWTPAHTFEGREGRELVRVLQRLPSAL